MNDISQLLGLPLHPLLVHGVVVLLPLSALALLLAQFWPSARRRLGVLTPLLALGVAGLVPLTTTAGQQLAEVVGPLPAVAEHERLGLQLVPWSIALAAVAVVQWAWFRWGAEALRAGGRARAARVLAAVLAVAVLVVAAGGLVLVVLTGHSGAEAVWGGFG
ncbi:hypothetical protein CFK38_03700 [Brachybacterium vulturis]|uniref:DUF2231 domain-containing protein n=1 Tax=Brachybacterium vulturis TaxID=2017484 RepID=A0A291GSX8_9MICO|nr:DUF2231 domain-containing protein [Brachybacterium vulturis]ATG53094.1 hypothetical protein CFK38_03700 [Brachybacterium vulturis]